MDKLLILAFLALSMTGADGEANEQERSKLTGTWKCVSAESEGKTMNPLLIMIGNLRLVFEGDLMTMKTIEGSYPYKYRLDTSTTPKRLDLSSTVPESPGIYEIEGDTLKMCLGKVRPTAFASPPGSDHEFLVYKRVKPTP